MLEIYGRIPPNLLLIRVFLELDIILSMAKEKIINIRVDAELKKQAKKLAEDDGRSLSNWILRLIQNEIKKTAKQKDGG